MIRVQRSSRSASANGYQVRTSREKRHMDRLLAAAGKEPPQLVRGEREDRGHQARQAVGHHVHRRLRRSSLTRPGGEGVQPILRHVGVERAQIERGERVERLEDRSVLVHLVRAQNSLGRVGIPREDVPVDLFEAAPIDEVGRGVEIVQIRNQIPQRIADLAIGFDDACQDLLAEAHFLRVVAHRDPQPEDVGAALFDDVLRLDRVAERLRHLPPVLGHDEAVGDRPRGNGARPRVPRPTSSEL